MQSQVKFARENVVVIWANNTPGCFSNPNLNKKVRKKKLCFLKNGIDQSIIRAYHSYGKIDLDAKNNIFYSNKAGLATDVYMFPCRGKNATSQV